MAEPATPTSQPKQPTGDWYLTKNRYRNTDASPYLKGNHTKPGSEVSTPVFGWVYEFADKKSGELKICYGGTIGEAATEKPAEDQIRALMDPPSRGETVSVGNLTLAPRTWVAFPNAFKDEPTQSGKPRPANWGWVNPGDGTPPYRISSWTKTFDDGHAYLSGNTQYPEPGKTEIEQQDAATDVERLVADGKAAKGIRKPRESRPARGE